ncbi:30S ribosomal protein S2 [Candidatus Dojkabacteria bacterium]|uniref:Small ribosomal subunit protein uS2 n=1 Tax=Candidatus Dojkabacteria bacterium TaxID=2099670 RepID=A0A955L3B0_9BACT|nr:30S ribosomal protein S2 [Candidatus Dojkabacteria bacterium]
MAEYKAKYSFAFNLPTTSDLLKAGVQFGHQTKRWNPKMGDYIYTQRGNIHILDIAYTLPTLEEALNFLREASSRGEVIFVGTKRQAREIVEKEAIECGAHFVVDRWPGGMLSNFDMTKRNLRKLNELTKELKEGVEDRTKQEIVWMKNEWARLDRLYRGIRFLEKKPTAMVVMDLNIDKGAIHEAHQLGIPVVGILDSNVNPDDVEYGVVGNDDALSSLTLFVTLFGKAVKEGNKGKGVQYEREDLTKIEVKRLSSKPATVEGDAEEVKIDEVEEEIETEEKSQVETKSEDGVTKIRVKLSEDKKSMVKETKTFELEDLGLSGRTLKSLKDGKVTAARLQKMGDADILDVKGIGKKGLEEVKAAQKKMKS